MCELEPHASHTCSLSHHNHSHFGKKLQLKVQSFPFKLYTMAGLSIASELENAGSLIEVQVAAGMGEADVKEILARSYEARITELPTLSSEQKAKLTSAINGGPWTTEQRKMLASAVLNNGSRKRNAASMSKRLNQKCHNIENLIPTTYMVKLKDTDKYSEISRLSIIAAAAKTIGIVNPDETTLFRMVSIVAACAPASSFSQREVWDHMSTIQKFIKAGAASKLEYLSNFPPTAELLPEAIQTAAYAGEPAGLPPTLQWAELDTVLGDMKQRGSRSSSSTSSKSATQASVRKTPIEPKPAAPAGTPTPNPLPSVDVWRLASNGPQVCSPKPDLPVICDKCKMSLADGHTHGKAVSGDLSDVPTAHDGEQDGDEGGTEFGLDAFEKSVRDAQAARKAGAANMKRPAGKGKAKAKATAKVKAKAEPKSKLPAPSSKKLVLGCSKCRFSSHGCEQCKNPRFSGMRGRRTPMKK